MLLCKTFGGYQCRAVPITIRLIKCWSLLCAGDEPGEEATEKVEDERGVAHAVADLKISLLGSATDEGGTIGSPRQLASGVAKGTVRLSSVTAKAMCFISLFLGSIQTSSQFALLLL